MLQNVQVEYRQLALLGIINKHQNDKILRGAARSDRPSYTFEYYAIPPSRALFNLKQESR